MDVTVSPVNAGLWPALEDLFGRAGASICVARCAWLVMLAVGTPEIAPRLARSLWSRSAGIRPDGPA